MTSLIEEKDAIRELNARYCFLVDEARFDEWVDLWTEDALFDIDGREVRGHAGLKAFTQEIRLVDGMPPMKHLILNHLIEVNGLTATGQSYLLVVMKRKDGSLTPVTAGTYADRLVKRNGRWLLAERRLRGDLRWESASPARKTG